ncbi:hypothetical protein WICMUC_003947 [Wickerhamomyces mucosus]|uniref:Replication protein A subunit n=1 Tax=Wickerhamomyces mucosus TaxID=1378264 RepID=A0A9P8TBU1_9ASCO|nr:hypothetical protein WICMUC_003947 [Wickerhamomyces mucosus]
MSEEVKLDTSVLPKLFSDEKYIPCNQKITLQVLNAKVISNEEPKRYRLLLSDGTYSAHGVLRPESVAGSPEVNIQKSSILTLNNYEVEVMGSSNKHVIIVESFTLVRETASKIGEKQESLDEYFKRYPELDKLKKSDAEGSPAPQVAQQQQAAISKPQQQPQKQPQQQSNVKKPDNLYLIEQLSPYQNVWTLKARVSYKGELRTWSNARGSGKLFNVNFLDESGEIRATAFNENAEKFSNLLQEGKVYYISKARIQPPRKQFSNLNATYELQLDRDTIIEEAQDSGSVPKLNFNFVKLNKIQDLESDSIIDAVGVIKEVNPAFQITSRAGKAYDRRDITIVDDSQFAITVGLWNQPAVTFGIPEGTVVAVKGAKVSDFGGKSLSLTHSGVIVPNPDAPEAYTIKGWYDAQGRNESFQSLKQEPGVRKSSPSERKTIQNVQDLEINLSDKPEYHTIKASVSFLKNDNFSYPACATEGCNKKVIDQGDGTWRCEKCDITHANPSFRYILTVSVLDETGQLWLTLFDDQAKQLLGISADDLVKLRDENNAEFMAHFEKVQMNEYEFRIRGRQDSYNGQTRVKYSCFNVGKINFSAESDYLVDKFSKIVV